jgi:hypothetical protein
MFRTYVASVLSSVAYVFQWLFMCFGVFASVSDACFKCFIYLYTYVAHVSYGCFKNRSGATHFAMALVAGEQQPNVGLQLLPHAAPLVLSSPLPLLHLASMLALALR